MASNGREVADHQTPAPKLQIYPTSCTEISPFWKEKYERDAKKYWDVFYKRHQDRFFKDRHYLDKEWGRYFDGPGQKVVLEVGCGAGNTIFPLVATYPNIFVHACDFSPRAIDLVKAHKDFTEERVSGFVCDLTLDDLSKQISPSSVDIVTMIFVLSAVSPEKMPLVLQNIKRILKPNGRVMFRDYAIGDLAQERFTSKDQKISENFYVRGDGTVLIRRAQAADVRPGHYKLSAGQDIMISVYNIHHSSKVWERAEEFVPERGDVGTHQTTFGRRHLKSWSDYPILRWPACFLRKFYGSVSKTDYFTLRHGFITAHFSEDRKFNFQKFINRSLEEDFLVIVGVSLWVWTLAVLFIFFNAHEFHNSLWLPFFPLVMLLVVGTQLQVIITEMCLDSHGKDTVVRGTVLVRPSDDYFWFHRPHLLLHIMHFILFQMGSSMKKAVFTKSVINGLNKWRTTAKRNLAVRKGISSHPSLDTSLRTSPSLTADTSLSDGQEIEMTDSDQPSLDAEHEAMEIIEEEKSGQRPGTEHYNGEISFGWLQEEEKKS